jgi:3-phenylpropionate/trans-cinnamate dioxygenase ferredoxin component
MNDENRYPVASDHIPEPGRMKRIEAFGERVMIANLAGEYFAVSDTCSHEDASLSLGALKSDATVACPLHGSRFCLRTGQALDEPAEEPLHAYRVAFEDGTMVLYREGSA